MVLTFLIVFFVTAAVGTESSPVDVVKIVFECTLLPAVQLKSMPTDSCVRKLFVTGATAEFTLMPVSLKPGAKKPVTALEVTDTPSVSTSIAGLNPMSLLFETVPSPPSTAMPVLVVAPAVPETTLPLT
jgi:hypothetical protein